MISALTYFRLGQLMQEFLPHVLVNHAFTLHEAVDIQRAPKVITMEVQRGEPIVVPQNLDLKPIDPGTRAAFKEPVEHIREEIIKLQFKASYDTVQAMLKDLDKPDYTIRGLADDARELHGRLVSELKYTTCLALWEREEKLYRADKLFGGEVAERFPATVVDVEEAGKCLALNRGTACVFHIMRVLESGLQALAADLGVAKLDRNWQILINEMDKAVRALPFSTSDEKQRLAERSGALAHLRNVKDAWRNDVMHPRDTYTPEQARDVFDHARALMVSLAGFL